MKETWKMVSDPVVQERYAISSKGRVIDLIAKSYLNFFDNGAGYKVYGLQRKDKSNVAIRYVHRLIALAFLENPQNKPQVGHKDHDRANNVLENPEWVTQRENTRYGIKEGRINANRPKTNRRVTPETICKIAKLEDEGLGVNEIALTLGFPRTTISSVFNKRSSWELFEFARQETQLSKSFALPS